MPTFYCPVCNFKSFTEKDEKEHAITHKNPVELGVMKTEEQKKEFVEQQLRRNNGTNGGGASCWTCCSERSFLKTRI